MYVIGVDPSTAATAVAMQKKQQQQSSGMNTYQVAGLGLAVVALVLLGPKIIKWVG